MAFNISFLVIDDNLKNICNKLKFQVSTSHKCKLLTWCGFVILVQALRPLEKDMDKFHKPYLVLTPAIYVLERFGFKLAHML
jgi:hypothetical protein